jgi:hypothetical protein
MTAGYDTTITGPESLNDPGQVRLHHQRIHECHEHSPCWATATWSRMPLSDSAVKISAPIAVSAVMRDVTPDQLIFRRSRSRSGRRAMRRRLCWVRWCRRAGSPAAGMCRRSGRTGGVCRSAPSLVRRSSSTMRRRASHSDSTVSGSCRAMWFAWGELVSAGVGIGFAPAVPQYPVLTAPDSVLRFMAVEGVRLETHLPDPALGGRDRSGSAAVRRSAAAHPPRG